MKKKIGFIDLFIDEWHANNYPPWFRSAPLADKFELGFAWQEQVLPDKLSLNDWCRKFEMCPAASIEEVVEKSDAICVLAPSNPEVHERLAQIPLRSGKPVYIDKPFAPDKKTAEAIFALAEAHHTPLMSSSALRYANGIIAARSGMFKDVKPNFVQTTGGGRTIDEYGIHQLEMIVSMMGTGASRVQQRRQGVAKQMLIDYDDGRFASISYHPSLAFSAVLANDRDSAIVTDMDQMFQNLLAEILKFFESGISPIDSRETIEIASLLGRGLEALKNPDTWLSL